MIKRLIWTIWTPMSSVLKKADKLNLSLSLLEYIETEPWDPVAFLCSEGLHHPSLNTLRLRQNGRRFADDTFKRIFLNENVGISIKISLKFVPKGPINNIPALVQILAWRRSGDKPLSEPMVVSLLTHICITRPQWVKAWWKGQFDD